MASNSNINEIFDCINIKSYLEKIPTSSLSNIHLFCLHVNIRSMILNFPKLIQIIDSCKPPLDVVVVTEVNISEGISNLFNIPGFNMYTQLRNHCKGGGIIIYVKNCLKFTRKQTKTHYFENITGTLKTPYCAISVCAIYRPPSLSKQLFITELEHLIMSDCKDDCILIIGDTNIDLKTISKHRDYYLDMLSGFGLMCGVSDYTRIEMRKNKVSKSCIDHIFARLPTLDQYSAAIDTVLADHRVVTIAACARPVAGSSSHIQAARRNKQKSTMHRGDIMLNELHKINWDSTDDMKDPDDIYKFLITNFTRALNVAKTITHNLPKKRFCEPWITSNIITLCEKRDLAFNIWKKDTSNVEKRLAYNTIRNKTHKVIEHSRNTYYKKQIENNFSNSRKMWQILNSMCGRTSNPIDQAILNAFSSQNITSKEIANIFADTFDESVQNILPNCNINLSDAQRNRTSSVSIYYQKATPDKISKVIKQLNDHKAPGLDGVRVIDIKKVTNNIASAICNLINTAIKTGQYPDGLKIGCIRPVFKKGKRENASDYRPITLLSSIDKIIEKFVCDQIHSFYQKNNIISKSQFGFQPKKNTTMLLSKFTDDINTYLNNKKQVLALFIDFSRAFDTLDHKKLIGKLDANGIRGPLLRWCESYLRNRSSCVKIDDSLSDQRPAAVGTAQGSVLGPLHFLTYVNDMCTCLDSCTAYQFADDTCFIIASDDVNSAMCMLQADFDKLKQWCHDSGLVLNSNKTKLILIKSPYMKSNLETPLISHSHTCMHDQNITKSCHCPNIELVNSHVYLGLVIDHKFNWNSHIERVCTKLRAFLANMHIIKNRLPFNIRLMLYNALADSVISYGLSSYGLTHKTSLDCILRLQIKILKNIVPPKIRLQYSNDKLKLFKYCKTLPVHTKVEYTLLKEQFFNLSVQKPLSHKIGTRSCTKKKLMTLGANNFYGKRRISYLIPRLLNGLCPELKSSIHPKNINHKLKSHFISLLP